LPLHSLDSTVGEAELLKSRGNDTRWIATHIEGE
jgi:hypothetical protein